MPLISVAKTILPAPLRKSLKKFYQSTLDLTDAGSRRRDMIPPRSMNFVGDGDFLKAGLEFRRLFIEFGGLKPDHRVLDVGSGIGRMAGRLTSYLSPQGEYQGLDIVKMGIDWCQANITPRYPNFHFQHADVRNDEYNPGGIYRAATYSFPYADGYFDFVYLTSVFTHMFTADMERYLAEISRVLKVGGTGFITVFLMNDESRELIAKGRSSQNMIHKLDGCYTKMIENPEAAIAFEEDYMRSAVQRFGLSLSEPIHFGSWCGRSRFLSYQDILITQKI
jgi:ubiquinone/menaquinone biosynthesis C-methylase UbiE